MTTASDDPRRTREPLDPPGFAGIDVAGLRDSWRLCTIAAGWQAVDAVAGAVLPTGPALSARPELAQACYRLGRSRAEAGIGALLTEALRLVDELGH